MFFKKPKGVYTELDNLKMSHSQISHEFENTYNLPTIRPSGKYIRIVIYKYVNKYCAIYLSTEIYNMVSSVRLYRGDMMPAIY